MVGDWILMMDDDHTFLPDMLERLLVHVISGAADVVCPFVLRRDYPWTPVAYVKPPAGLGGVVDISTIATHGLVTLDPRGKTGLIPVEETGTAGMLIHKRVLDGVEGPWFRVGETEADRLTEDRGFCRRARMAGFRVAIDLDTPMGHMAKFVISPMKSTDPDTWPVMLISGHGTAMAVDVSKARENALPEYMGFGSNEKEEHGG